MKEGNYLKNSKKQIITTVIAITVFLLLAIIVSRPLLKIVGDHEAFAEYISSKKIAGVIIFSALNIVQVIFAIIPAGPFEIVAGYAFGIVRGTIICDIAVTIGSIFVFIMVRKLGTKFTSFLISFNKLQEVKFLQDVKKLTLVLLLIFLIPGSPKDVITYAAGFTKIPFKNWIFVNVIGRIPGILLTVISGSALGEKKYKIAIIMWSVTFILYIIGAIIYNKYSKNNQSKENTNQGE